MKTVRLGKTGLEVSEGSAAFRQGDTARSRFGSHLHRHDRREQVIIATKSGARDKATALEHLELSLKRLNTDYREAKPGERAPAGLPAGN